MYDTNAQQHSFHIFDLKENFPIFYTGASGVIIFFLISGYIIPSAIVRSKTIKHFLVNRVIRIYPLLIVVMIYGAFRFDDFKARTLLGLVLPLADFINGRWVAKGVDWTLRIEFLYYIIIALIYFKGKFNIRNMVVCIAITSVLAVMVYFLNKAGYYLDKKGINYKLLYLNFIFVGSILYILEQERFINTKSNIWAFVSISCVVFIFEFFRVSKDLLLPSLLFGGGLFVALYLLHQTKFKIKSNNLIVFLGNLSYASYLLHLMIYEDLYNISQSHIATPILFTLICYCAYLFVEKPSMIWFKAIYKRNLKENDFINSNNSLQHHRS